jgi:hypothetical protein
LVRLENSDGVAVLQNGHPDSEGLLTVRDIRPGNYRMTIKAPGCATGFTAVTIKPDHPTLVGFPSPVRLPLETETASTGANTN